MTTHALLKPITEAPNGIHWDTICGLRVLMPKQKFKTGAGINVADGWNGMCAACHRESPKVAAPVVEHERIEQRTPEQIEAEQRRQEEAGILAVTFDDSIGDIESDDAAGDAEDEELIAEEKEEYPEA